jgi:hypothetical protein
MPGNISGRSPLSDSSRMPSAESAHTLSSQAQYSVGRFTILSWYYTIYSVGQCTIIMIRSW